MLIEGIVIKSTGSWYDVRLDNGEFVACRIKGKFRLGTLKLTNPVAVGDRVMVNIEKEEETVGTIREIKPRKNYVLRQSPRKKHFLHIIASNIDQAIVIVSMRQPSVKVGFIDRFLLMTEPYNIPVTIVFNKSDLHESEDVDYLTYLRAVYENIGYKTILTSTVTGEGLHELEDIIDTPGIKTLGFNYLEEMDVAHNFREFFELSKDCKFGDCLHRNEPNCAVKTALENQEISPFRYENYLAILDEIENQNYWEIQKDM
ncbi:unnamed protein product [Cyprideis torosa]|uniref:Uncharacterized protein n=1 Tax=Cyprideis torosa TaxID=163714 RepID=A0A7R8ZU18_9CRUS|nr:unnamed protein product [Cyprideis torosa]CAG0909035.1 unnamed protein product [Cyprideis torosa]